MSKTSSPTDLAAKRLWSNGWYKFAKRVDSPHFGARPEGLAIDLVVVHSISLPPGVYTGDAVVNFLTGQVQTIEHPYLDSIKDLKVSAHFFIRRQGELIQMVSCDDKAWHAGVSNWLGREGCNDFSIGIELEGSDFEAFEPVQYETLKNLVSAIKECYPIEAITGHSDIAPGRKTDPGPYFDWSEVKT